MRGESALMGTGASDDVPMGMAQVIDREPTPQFAAMLAEEYQSRLDGLPDDQVRRVAEMRFQGYENQEIASALDCSLRSVERKLQLIRSLWSDVDSP